jgi:hypothetical protein
MSSTLAQSGYSIRYADCERRVALDMAVKKHGLSGVVDCLKKIRKSSSAYGCQHECTNISQKIEKLHLKLTERDIEYVIAQKKDVKNVVEPPKDTAATDYINSQRAMQAIAMKFRY